MAHVVCVYQLFLNPMCALKSLKTITQQQLLPSQHLQNISVKWRYSWIKWQRMHHLGQRRADVFRHAFGISRRTHFCPWCERAKEDSNTRRAQGTKRIHNNITQMHAWFNNKHKRHRPRTTPLEMSCRGFRRWAYATTQQGVLRKVASSNAEISGCLTSRRDFQGTSDGGIFFLGSSFYKALTATTNSIFRYHASVPTPHSS